LSLFGLFAVLITATALLAYANERWLRLPPTIGVMASALILSIVLAAAGRLGWVETEWASALIEQIDFDAVLMHGMLSFLLFAGALHVDLGALAKKATTVLSLATVGVLMSTLLMGGGFWLLARLFDLPLPFPYALVFGALISPTDPIAVLGILKGAGAPKELELKIVGESLLNDGVGVVLFSLLLSFAVGGTELSASHAGLLFLEEAVGGVVLGLLLGFMAYRMLRSVDHVTVEILITVALVAGGYALAGALHTSGPLAMVVAGLLIGNHGRSFGMSDRTRQHLDTFWELIDEILNAMLFVMIGLEVLVLHPSPRSLLLGAVAIPLALLVRFVAVGVPISLLRLFKSYGPGTVGVLTWGGIRGGISIALALSLPPSPQRELLLVVTYVVVIFSILVQGLTLGRVVRRLTRAA